MILILQVYYRHHVIHVEQVILGTYGPSLPPSGTTRSWSLLWNGIRCRCFIKKKKKKKVAHGDEYVCGGIVIVVNSSNVFAWRLHVLLVTLS